jgi:mono-ADP-ribosyltransferase sirtuin 6
VLHDNIVNFGESLPAHALERTFQHAKRADLCLVLGSSLIVSPANEIPELPGRRKAAKFAICNFQTTPLDEPSDVRVFSKTDDRIYGISNAWA